MILHQTRSPDDWKIHLAKGEKHWRPGFSAMETAYAWEANRSLPPEIQKLFPDARLLQAIVEYPVPLPGGTTESMNDVFALLSDGDGLVACMVEAKRNEPFGDTLEVWRHSGSAGKTERLAFLCETLGLNPESLPAHLRYQLFHRTASALLAARAYHARRAVMLVQSFSQEGKWFDDYAAFAALFGITARQGVLQRAQDKDIQLDIGWVTSPLREGAS
jgi:hypothetical protein